MYKLKYYVGKVRSEEISGKETSSFVQSGSMSSSSRSLSNAFRVSSFLPQQILRILIQQYGIYCVFWRLLSNISQIQRNGKIRSSKVDMLLKQIPEAISILRQT